jgi:hypothetical protein
MAIHPKKMVLEKLMLQSLIVFPVDLFVYVGVKGRAAAQALEIEKGFAHNALAAVVFDALLQQVVFN